MDSLQGKLLIASPRLMDPNFARTVVLMVQHNAEGALGLILNRPLDTTVRQICQQSLGEPCDVEGYLHQGGPCEGPLMVLHRSEPADDAEACGGVFFTTERSKIETLLRENAPARYFVGYSGWAAGQLEREMETQSWLIAEADSTHVFHSESNLWSALMTERMTGQSVDPDSVPDDPSVN